MNDEYYFNTYGNDNIAHFTHRLPRIKDSDSWVEISNFGWTL
jgi:hypothetical protein